MPESTTSLIEPLLEDFSRYVVHCKKEPFDVYIGRPSRWGNPYKVGVHGTREQVIEIYREYLKSLPYLMEHLPELKGKILGCWCSPKPCHGEVLARLAND